MNLEIKRSYQKYAIATTLSTILLFPLLNATDAYAAQAGESYGWFAPKVEYLNDTVGCDADQSSIEFHLYDADTEVAVSGSIGTWQVLVRDTDKTILASQSLNGELYSSPICFNPNTDSLQVIFNETVSYYDLVTPSISPVGDQSSMNNFHFKGIAYLQPKTDPSPHLVSLAPKDVYVNSATQSYFLGTESFPTLFGATQVSKITLYAVNLDTNALTTVTVPATGGINIREITDLPPLPSDGSYFWFYHQDYDGTNYTSKPSSPYNWTFDSLPSSGVTRPVSITLDSVIPTTNFVQKIEALGADGGLVTVKATLNLADTSSGLAQSYLEVLDSSDNIIATVDVPLSAERDEISITVTMDLPENSTVSLKNTLTDMAGNISTSVEFPYAVPSAADLDTPTMGAVSPWDVRSTRIALRSHILDTGGSLVTARGTCWELNSSDFTTATDTPRCQASYSTTGFSTGWFENLHTNFTSNTTIYYRGFATNGSGTSFSPILSTTTRPLANDTWANPTAPILEHAYNGSTTADYARIGAKLNSSGGAIITSRGICWATSPSALPAEPDFSSSCYRWSLPVGAVAVPFWYERGFYGLPHNTKIFTRGYASNSVGTTTIDSTFTTQVAKLDIELLDYTATSTYDEGTKKYTVEVPVTVRDKSNFTSGTFVAGVPVPRGVKYTARIEKMDGTVLQTITGDISAKNIYNPFPIQPLQTVPISFDNLDPGFVKIIVIANEPEETYVELAGDKSNNTKIKIINLVDPDIAQDIAGGSGGGTGPVLDLTMEIDLDGPIIRSNTGTDLYWDTKEPYPMDCTIYGPSTFGNNGRFDFDPSINGKKVGLIPTGPLTSAQIFEIECYEPVTDSYFYSSRRVDVAGIYSDL